MKTRCVVLVSTGLTLAGCGDDSPAPPRGDSSVLDASTRDGAVMDAATPDAASPASDAASEHDAATSNDGGRADDAGDAQVDEWAVECAGGSPLGCFSASGEYGDVRFACPRDVFQSSVGKQGNDNTFIYTCDDVANGLRVRVEFEGATYGNLVANAPSTTHEFLKVSVRPIAEGSTGSSLTEASTNLYQAHLGGTSGPDAPEVLAHVTASWTTSSTGCSSGDGTRPCGEGRLSLSLHTSFPHE